MLVVIGFIWLLTSIEFNQSKYTAYGFFMQVFMLNGLGFPEPLQWNFVSWSVSSEFAAYLSFPLLVTFLPRLKAFSSLVLSALIFLLCFVLAYYINDGKTYFLEGPYILTRIGSEFVVGCLLYNIYRDEKWRHFFLKNNLFICSSFICDLFH